MAGARQAGVWWASRGAPGGGGVLGTLYLLYCCHHYTTFIVVACMYDVRLLHAVFLNKL